MSLSIALATEGLLGSTGLRLVDIKEIELDTERLEAEVPVTVTVELEPPVEAEAPPSTEVELCDG